MPHNIEADSILSTGPVAMSVPRCSKGIGSLLTSSESRDRIAGVRLAPLTLWPDDRGYFLELHRLTQGFAGEFPPATSQVSAALSYPGTIKAFHYHKHQTDCWTPVLGMFQISLVDLRPESGTFGQKNTIYAGTLRPLQLIIPPGVAHGYKIVSQEAGLLVYMTDRFYNPADEGRIPWDDAGLNYDWETQFK